DSWESGFDSGNGFAQAFPCRSQCAPLVRLLCYLHELGGTVGQVSELLRRNRAGVDCAAQFFDELCQQLLGLRIQVIDIMKNLCHGSKLSLDSGCGRWGSRFLSWHGGLLSMRSKNDRHFTKGVRISQPTSGVVREKEQDEDQDKEED